MTVLQILSQKLRPIKVLGLQNSPVPRDQFKIWHSTHTNLKQHDDEMDWLVVRMMNGTKQLQDKQLQMSAPIT